MGSKEFQKSLSNGSGWVQICADVELVWWHVDEF